MMMMIHATSSPLLHGAFGKCPTLVEAEVFLIGIYVGSTKSVAKTQEKKTSVVRAEPLRRLAAKSDLLAVQPSKVNGQTGKMQLLRDPRLTISTARHTALNRRNQTSLPQSALTSPSRQVHTDGEQLLGETMSRERNKTYYYYCR